MNTNGLSYGSDANAATPADAPDLILAIANNGRTGYVLKTDLYPFLLTGEPDISTQGRKLPVFLKDGTTVIGTFDLQPGQAEYSD